MARRYRCPRPVNRLVMHRTKGLSGPMLQNVGVACMHSTGAAYSPGGPLSGPKAVTGLVVDATSIHIGFTQCVSISGPAGIEYQIDGGAWTQVTAATKISDTLWDFTTGTIEAGDEVVWRYVGGSGTILDCRDADDIGDQQLGVDNPLVLAGNFILLETGGKSKILLEDDIDLTRGIKTEDAV